MDGLPADPDRYRASAVDREAPEEESIEEEDEEYVVDE
jgi:hypothetical protein